MTGLTDTIRASHTWREIHAQPSIWRAWGQSLDVQAERDWIAAQGIAEVWFCGAGTSAYIGDILTAGLPQHGAIRFRSVPSTDLVARPRWYLGKAPRGLLIVNFGRSGNSSETLGTLDAVCAIRPDCAVLNITCNPQGALARPENGHAILLPEACHDAGFAMTSSFSTMLLTALSLFAPDRQGLPLARLADCAEAALPVLAGQLAAMPVPKRAVFVGSGPMAYAARESALKVMELTAGQVPALWDSTLGLRHGPKSFVTEDTAIFALTGAGAEAAPYDADLVAELRVQFPQAQTVTVGPVGDMAHDSSGDPLWDCVLSVLPAQLAAVIWSDRLGLNIDDPFAGQSTLTRVVSGVQLHPVLVP